MSHQLLIKHHSPPLTTLRWWLGIAVSALVLLALVACSDTANPADDQAATQVVKSFVTAVEDRNASGMLNLIEPADWRKDIGPELRSYVSYLKSAEFHDPQYTVIDNTGDLAHVRLVSTMEYEIEGVPPAEQPWNLVFEVVKLDGTWYLRNFELPTGDTPVP